MTTSSSTSDSKSSGSPAAGYADDPTGRDTPAGGFPAAAARRQYIWMDAGHVGSHQIPEDVRVQHGMVAVDPDTGDVLLDQPDYPEPVEEPPPSEPKDEEPAAKTSSTATKSTSS